MQEESDVPILCEVCLGENPFVRMQKFPLGAACKVCSRAFTLFRYKPGTDARHKKTQICQSCAQMKNVCQTCLLDLRFNLPVAVRDHLLGGEKMVVPISAKQRDFQAALVDSRLSTQGPAALVYHASDAASGSLDAQPPQNADRQTEAVALALATQLQRPQPKYERNRAPICAYFSKGLCNRGSTCPFRHVAQGSGAVDGTRRERNDIHKSIASRYYGINDEVADSMLSRIGALAAPAGWSGPVAGGSSSGEAMGTRSLCIRGFSLLDGKEDSETIRLALTDKFGNYGALESVRVLWNDGLVFVNYQSEADAVNAMTKVSSSFTFMGQLLRVGFARQKPKDGAAGAISGGHRPQQQRHQYQRPQQRRHLPPRQPSGAVPKPPETQPAAPSAALSILSDAAPVDPRFISFE